MKDFLGNPDLFQIFLAGVGMVGIYDTGRICQVPFSVKLVEET